MRRAPCLMIQGTASSVGKSLVVTALCRYFKRRGLRVAPFKAQNMALNSFVTFEGGEIGRAQAVQAEACGIEPSLDMNPILLKCESDHLVQLVVQGKAEGSMTGAGYYQTSDRLRPIIEGSLNRLREKYDLVLMEGAGSPAEINLQERDLANMFPAQIAEAPVLLVGDINLGGVFASLIGTLELLKPLDRARVKGMIINKFRGDLEILKPGISFLEKKTGLPVLGVLPFIPEVGIAEEDSVSLDRKRVFNSPGAVLQIAVLRFPRISNFDDFLPLEKTKGVGLRYVKEPQEAQGADLVILPGTKTTVEDLRWLRRKGFDRLLAQRASEAKPILGICGGYQMLGEKIEDPQGVESSEHSVPGLGLLPILTVFEKEKQTAQLEASVLDESFPTGGSPGRKMKAYEIHMGQVRASRAKPLFQITSRNGRLCEEREGAVQGAVFGTLLHGIFDNDFFRRTFLEAVGKGKNFQVSAEACSKEEEYDRLADWVESHLDRDFLDQLAGRA